MSCDAAYAPAEAIRLGRMRTLTAEELLRLVRLPAPITAQPDKPSYRPRKPRPTVDPSRPPITAQRLVGRTVDTLGIEHEHWETVASF